MNKNEFYGSLLSGEDRLSLHRVLLWLMSPAEAVLFSELCQEASDLEQIAKREKQEWSGWFRYSLDNVKSKINFPHDLQARTIKKLKELGYVDVTLMGNPAKRHFKIDYSRLSQDVVNLTDYRA